MFKKLLLTLAFTSQLLSCAGSQPQNDIHAREIYSGDIDLATHFELKEKWLNSGIDSYDMTVSYNAFSPKRGLWYIEVRNGELFRWEINGRVNDEKDKAGASMFLQVNLFERAEDAYGESKLYTYSTIYSENGYIKLISKGLNPDAPGDKPKDTGYLIAVTDFKLILGTK